MARQYGDEKIDLLEALRLLARAELLRYGEFVACLVTATGCSDAIRVGTFAKSKGLEFKLAILAGAGKAGWAVKPFWLRDAADIDAWWATELRTFYVAMTRARDRLAVLSAPELAPPIARARELFDEWDWRVACHDIAPPQSVPRLARLLSDGR
jgi:superfamily I DNA/RNA helicase